MTPTERRLLIAVLIAQSVNAAEATGAVTAMPAVTDALDGDRFYGAAFTVYMLTSVISGVAAGQESDRRAPRRVFLVAVTLFTIGSLVAALAPTMPVFIAGRALQGLGGGAFYNLCFVAIARGIDISHRSRALAWQSTAWVVPGLVAPLFAGWISDVLSWRWFFAGLLPLVPILVVMALPSLSNLQPPPDLEVSANRIPAALLLATGGGLLLTGLDQLDEAWGLPVTAAGAVVTVIALQRLLPRGWWWLSGGLASLVTFRLLLNSAFFGTDSFIPFAATEIHGSSKTAAGFLLVGGTLSWTVASWSQSRVRQRLSAPVMLASGAVVVAACSAAMITITRQSTPVWWAFVIWTVAGFGVGLAFTGSTMHATVLGEESGFGEVGGNLEVVDAFGFALMAGIGGAVVAAGERNGTDASSVSSTIFAMTAVVGVVCAIAALRIGRRTTAT